MDFLGLTRQSGHFNRQDFRSQADPGFRRVAIETMPDNRLHAPARWRPDSPSTDFATALAPAQPGGNTAGESPAPSDLDSLQTEQIRQVAFDEGFAQGLREGLAQAQAQHRQQMETAQQQHAQLMHDGLARMTDAVLALREQPDTLHEPLKRLALHLAEELVLGELQISAQAIDRLVQRCIDELQAGQQADVCIELNPGDLERLQSQPALESDRPKPWRWEPNADLLPGSVRVRVDDAMVTDLIEHRLQSLASSLLGQPQRWSAQSTMRSDRISARFGQAAPVSDVQARPSAGSPEQQDGSDG